MLVSVYLTSNDSFFKRGLKPFFVYTIRKGSEKVVPGLKKALIAYKKEFSFSLFTNTVTKEKLFRISKTPHILSMGKLNLLVLYVQSNAITSGVIANSFKAEKGAKNNRSMRPLEKAAGLLAKGWLYLTLPFAYARAFKALKALLREG
ncbi:hypothetical protein GGTG_02576 [Gaeumannomyces tritici R3-111a-1]|uniref:Uncharacterized protein n=1 Tax=Gaeumannomyces tritici (strain R3-111a-1) TaxID=644352 RepID=J3NMS0_GAET3|nr:hypothetical protein GGTG_02576 [Gaeumannomyces tritici R3-111a-1]EJT82603.1 hypothetical protein GGTG_02576 [Gaeumannomyces tritici R3-111a-1]